MLTPAGVALAVVIVAMVLLALEWLAPDFVLLGALAVVTAVGVVDTERALHGFADPTILAIGALFVVAAGLRSTGVLGRVATLLLGRRRAPRVVLARLTTASASASAFLNNTPIVAMGIPAVLAWSRDRSPPASRLLLPLSYASILGGVCTLIGTSTNLVTDGLLRDGGWDGLGFFELAWVGVPLTILGIAYLVFLGPRFLPYRAGIEAASRGLGGAIHLYRVPEQSHASGRSVGELALVTSGVKLVRIVRRSGEVESVRPETTLAGGDRLTFRGDARTVGDVASGVGLDPVEIDTGGDIGPLRHLREVVVPEGSELAETPLSSINFPDRYGAVVLGVVRNGRQLGEARDVVLRPGDSLFLATTHGFIETFADSKAFYIIGGAEVEPEALSLPIWRPTRAKAGLAILFAIVGVAASGLLHISIAALLGALLMVALGFLTPAEARRAVDWSVLLVIGAAIGLGAALQDSGAADLVAGWIVAASDPLGPRGVLAALIVTSSILTLLVTNTAAVAILFPVAVSVAGAEGLDPRPFVIAITVAASLAFATPVGYQTNLMVYGPGGYRFSDFLKVGGPLQVICAVAALVLVPMVWPF